VVGTHVSAVPASLRVRLWRARLRLERRSDLALFDKYRDATMIGESQFIDNLLLCRSAPAGSIVECGAWRGGMSAAMAEVAPGRRSELFDSFEGLPDASEFDGSAAREWMADGNLLVAPESAARASMARSGSHDFRLIKGWFAETLPEYAASRPSVAVLRIDGDWYDSTMCCLVNLFPHVVDDGIVIFDDYGYWEGCTRAVHDYLSAQERTEPLLHTRFDVTYLLKGSGQNAIGYGI
jgi:O-methyltransferase